MTYRQLFKLYRNSLSRFIENNEINAIFFIVLEHLMGFSKTDFYTKENEIVPSSMLERTQKILVRLKNNEPVQYILGVASFLERLFFVDSSVLIPRSETEELVNIVVSKKPDARFVIDLGTGSGCIAISIDLAMKSTVIGADISEKAIKIAQKNANHLQSGVEFLVDNILFPQKINRRTYDVIVSNPPYVKEEEKQQMLKNITEFEPAQALYVPNHNPLKFYKAIALFAHKQLNTNGLLAVEINETLGKETAHEFSRFFNNVNIHKDIHGKERFVTAKNE